MTALVLVLAALAVLAVLWPLTRPPRRAPEDTRRLELEEERELLLSRLTEAERDAEEAVALRERVRLGAVLRELEELPDTPRRRPGPALLPGLLALGVAALLLAVGTLTVFPGWRGAGLRPAEAESLQAALDLPRLARAAEGGAAQALLAYGDAAWAAGEYRESARAYSELLLRETRAGTENTPQALRRVGFVLLGEDQGALAEQGLGFIARAVQAAPAEPEGHLLLGYALGLYGEVDAALASLRRFQELAPGRTDADGLILELQAAGGSGLDGALVYAQNCAACHGPQGQGGSGGAILRSPTLQNEAALRALILGGAGAMPAFPGLAGEPLDALIAHLRILEGP